MLGVCYYPEHWPRSMWEDDAKSMKELGLTYVRIGEFAWSRIEPNPGQYEFDWLDDAIDVLHDAGLKVILGTPTATPPKWLIDLHPDILPVCPETGRTRGFGSRRHYDYSSQVYHDASMKISEILAKRYANHPAIYAWQTDNELSCHDTTISASDNALKGFRKWCEARYGDVATLNTAWGNVFWSMEYRHWDEIELPVGAVTETNPAHRLAFRRYSSDQVVRFHNDMIDVIRKHSPDKPVTHNFIPTDDTQTDNYQLAEKLDFVAYDNYPLGRSDLFFAEASAEDFAKYMRTGHPDFATFYHDQTRALCEGPYWIMEQQPGPVNWAFHNPRPAPGMIHTWSMESIAHGADTLCYFRWRQAPFAQEQMHAGLRRNDNSPSTAWAEATDFAKALEVVAPYLDKKKSRVAIMNHVSAQWVSEIEQQGQGYDYFRVLFDFYHAARSMGIDVDFISPDHDLDGYSLVLIPSLPIVPDDLVEKLKTTTDAQIVFGPRSGGKTDEFSLPDNLPPGKLQSVIPTKVLSVETLRPDCPGVLSYDGKNYASGIWREELDRRQCRGRLLEMKMAQRLG